MKNYRLYAGQALPWQPNGGLTACIKSGWSLPGDEWNEVETVTWQLCSTSPLRSVFVCSREMNNMRIAYCDDEPIQYIFLQELVSKWANANNEKCNITVYGSAEETLFENPESFPFDIIILDIEMNEMNGIDLAKIIRKLDKNVAIAFLSNKDKYVFEGYEVQAIRYLMKPLKEEQLFPILSTINESRKAEKRYIIVSSQGERIKLYVEDVMYIEAMGHYVKIAAEDNCYEIKKSINDISEELKSDNFISTHRSYIVNLAYIDRITRTDCILADATAIPISRNEYKKVNEAFIEYYKGGRF